MRREAGEGDYINIQIQGGKIKGASLTAFRPLHIIRPSYDITQVTLLRSTRSDAGRSLSDPARALRTVKEHLNVAHPITARSLNQQDQ